jgi:hypothetical protein
MRSKDWSSEDVGARAHELFMAASLFERPLPPAYVVIDVELLRSTTDELMKMMSEPFRDEFPVELRDGSLVLGDGDEETWRAALESMRTTTSMATGTAAKMRARYVARYLPEMAPRYLELHGRFVRWLRHVVAFMAFILGEDDEWELQQALLPAPPPMRPDAPSVSLDLG